MSEKSPGTSGTSEVGAHEPRAGRMPLWAPVVVWLVTAGLVCFLLAWLLFDSDEDGFRRQVSDSLLQLAVIGVVGGVIAGLVKHAFDEYDRMRESQAFALRKKQARDAEDNANRRDFLARMRVVHNAVAYAQWQIRAHPTRRNVYEKQMRELMRTTNLLWEIHADLQVAMRLFAPGDEEIREGIEQIIAFLEEGTQEYERAVGEQSANDFDVQRPGPWIRRFLARPPADSKRRLPAAYENALDDSKGRMRSEIYKDASAKS